jgi:hypothetical protein
VRGVRLYQYAPDHFASLQTRRKSGLASADEIKRSEQSAKKYLSEGAYVDHISFFFDPIPSKVLANIYGPTHRAWAKGTKLFEHVVDVTSLGHDVLYRVVESQRKTAFLDEFSKDNNWEDDDPAMLMKYIKEINALQRKWGELGTGLVNLEKQIALNVGKTEQAYVIASQREDFEWGREKYAANVPHLMVYPTSGEVAIASINSLVMGNDTRTPVKSARPASFHW